MHITKRGDRLGEQGRNDPHRNERGITTVELLVAMVITAIIGAFCLTFFVVSSGNAGTQVARQQQQASLLDAVNRVSRDVTYAQPIIFASSTDLILRTSTSSSQQTAIRYSAQGGSLLTWTIVNPTTFPATPTDSQWTAASGHLTVSRLDVTTVVPFTYFDRTGLALPATAVAPLLRSTGGTGRIGWVSMDFKSAPKDNKGFVELTGKARASSEAPIGVCLAPPAS